jgi:hypothetical protein
MVKNCILFLLLFLCASLAISENRVSGTFTANNKTVTLKYVDAKWVEVHYPEPGTALQIWVSDKVLPNERDSRIGKNKEYNAIKCLYSKKDNALIGCDLFHTALKKSYVTVIGNQKVQLTTLNDKVVEGKIWIEEPRKFFNETFQYEVEFRADIGKDMNTMAGHAEKSNKP